MGTSKYVQLEYDDEILPVDLVIRKSLLQNNLL